MHPSTLACWTSLSLSAGSWGRSVKIWGVSGSRQSRGQQGSPTTDHQDWNRKLKIKIKHSKFDTIIEQWLIVEDHIVDDQSSWWSAAGCYYSLCLCSSSWAKLLRNQSKYKTNCSGVKINMFQKYCWAWSEEEITNIWRTCREETWWRAWRLYHDKFYSFVVILLLVNNNENIRIKRSVGTHRKNIQTHRHRHPASRRIPKYQIF